MFKETATKPAITETNYEGFQVHIAVHAWEKAEIYKLRYQVYVEEMAKPLNNQLKKNQLTDALDDQSLLFYVQADKEIIATARLTIGTANDYPASLATIFHMHKIQAAFNDPHLLFALATKLAVKKEYRNSTALYQLSSEFYSILVKQDIRFWFGGCNPYLIPLYERMGFRRFGQNFWDEGYGLLIPLVILVDDSDYFHTVRSPLYRQARKRNGNPETSRKFIELFPETLKVLNNRLTTSQDLWDFLSKKLGKSPNDIPVFQNLLTDDLLALCESGAIFSCKAGDCLFEEHLACHDLYIVLSGKMASQSAYEEQILQAGDWFGEFQPQINLLQCTSIVALEESDLLVVPQQSLERYLHFYPKAAAVIAYNLKSKLNSSYHSKINQGGNCHA